MVEKKKNYPPNRSRAGDFSITSSITIERDKPNQGIRGNQRPRARVTYQLHHRGSVMSGAKRLRPITQNIL